jgi:glycosyltransferase involved in cell wall biosynthesis
VTEAVDESGPLDEKSPAGAGAHAPLENDLVSVVVATDRGGPFLAEALESATAQTYEPIEIVLVDDGAQDRDALLAITDRFPAVRVVHQANAGSSVARNNGVRLTSGDVLMFLDDDDRWAPGRVAAQVEALRAHPEAPVSYCAMRTIDAEGTVIGEADQHQVRDTHEVLQKKTGIILPNVAVRRSAFLRVGGFHPSFRRAQDLDLILKLALEGDFVFVESPLVDYRFHAGNNTRRYRELCRSIDHIVGLHRWNAWERGRTDLVADYDVALRSNDRFAWWSALRSARKRLRRGHVVGAASDVGWALGFAPAAPWRALRARARRGHEAV